MTENRHLEKRQEALEEPQDTASSSRTYEASPDEEPDQDDKAGYDVIQPPEQG